MSELYSALTLQTIRLVSSFGWRLTPRGFSQTLVLIIHTKVPTHEESDMNERVILVRES
jgi:hypothetical protein